LRGDLKQRPRGRTNRPQLDGQLCTL